MTATRRGAICAAGPRRQRFDRSGRETRIAIGGLQCSRRSTQCPATDDRQLRGADVVYRELLKLAAVNGAARWGGCHYRTKADLSVLICDGMIPQGRIRQQDVFRHRWTSYTCLILKGESTMLILPISLYYS